MSCVDLHLYVCETHQVIGAEVGVYDLVSERGGSSVEDPRQSAPFDLGDTGDVVDTAMKHLASWLAKTVVAPNPEIS